MHSRVGKIAFVAFALLPTVRAADTVFHNARLSRLDSNQESRIDLTLSDSSLMVREPKAAPVEIRYSSIQKITYQYSPIVERRADWWWRDFHRWRESS
jgi:hypothetical protein